MMEQLGQAFANVFGNWEVWLIVAAAASYGVFVGAVPGLTATMAVALFVPMTFWLDPLSALAAIVTMAACAIFAGDIPTVLLRIPGTPASAAYADDAYALTRRGKARDVLGTALLCSVVGGLFGALVLMLLGQWLAHIATMFSVAEYFWLYVLGLSCAVVISRGSPWRGFLGLLIGLMLSMVGLSAVHSQARFTFDQPQLFQGISFIPAMIGLFGISEVLHGLLRIERPVAEVPAVQVRGEQASQGWFAQVLLEPWTRILLPAGSLLRRRPLAALRSGSIGATVGMLPGAGADIGAWVSLAVSKRFQRATAPAADADKTTLTGIADATTANNAALAGSWIPALVFGIPGDSITAIVIGVLLMKNVKPGPEIFAKQAELVYSLYFAFILANLLLIPIGLAAIKLGVHLVRVPRRVLLPAILLFCVVGAFALNGSVFDIWTMLALGILGFVLERRRVPLGPVVLGIILGGPLEERFIQTLTGSDGSLLGLVNRPLSAGLATVCITLWISAVIWNTRRTDRSSPLPSED
jgi:TctA family transporter